jgi:hypothetical protein
VRYPRAPGPPPTRGEREAEVQRRTGIDPEVGRPTMQINMAGNYDVRDPGRPREP